MLRSAGHGSVETGGVSDTWGGAVVQDHDDNSTWHMFAAAMLGGCGISQWGTNSESTTRRLVATCPLCLSKRCVLNQWCCHRYCAGIADSPIGPFRS